MRSAVHRGMHRRLMRVLCGRGIDRLGTTGTVNSVSCCGEGAIVQSVPPGFRIFLFFSVSFRIGAEVVPSPIFGVALGSYPSSAKASWIQVLSHIGLDL